MVQIIPRAESSRDRFAKAFAGLSSSLAKDIPEELIGRQERKQLGELMGQDISNVRNPDMQRQLLMHSLQEKAQASKQKREMSEGLMDYDTVKKFAGKDVADFYKAAPIGGKTKIIQAIVDSMERGEKFGDLLGGAEGPTAEGGMPDMGEMIPEGIQAGEGKLNLPDFTVRPKGFTRKDWAKERTGWAETNTKSLDEAHTRLRDIKRDLLGTKKLQNLNESHKLPEGLGRFIINPDTGEPYKLAQLSGKVPTAAQEWVKEVARFGNRAKSAFGSRVTNFDLIQYMKQFPSLMNTPEGRRNILRMMEINYELDGLYENAVQQIIDQKGEGNIPPAQVNKIARKMIKDREEQLFDEYLNIEQQNDQSFMNEGMSRPSLEDIFGG